MRGHAAVTSGRTEQMSSTSKAVKYLGVSDAPAAVATADDPLIVLGLLF